MSAANVASPPPLPENRRVWFGGASVAAALVVSGRTAASWRSASPEWARPYVDASDWPEPPAKPRHWAIDFPPGYDEQNAARTGRPWAKFRAAGARLPRNGEAAELRIALAKSERFFAVPTKGPHRGDWRWLDARILPGRGLVVLARDDEFIAAIARSRWLALWESSYQNPSRLAALRSFPLPWSAETLRSALTREQEELRERVIRAARGDDTGELDHAVALAYGWSGSIDDRAASEALHVLHAARLRLSAADRAAGI